MSWNKTIMQSVSSLFLLFAKLTFLLHGKVPGLISMFPVCSIRTSCAKYVIIWQQETSFLVNAHSAVSRHA